MRRLGMPGEGRLPPPPDSLRSRPVPPLRLLTDSHPDPAVDTALSSAILQRVARGEIGPTLRLFVPGRIVAFGSQDRTRPGYREAVAAVGEVGFEAIERLAGGRAATFHEGTIAFAWATPHRDSKAGIEDRFHAITAVVVDALERLGISGTVAETPGEYCPGRFSVAADGRKVMGVGQRLVTGAAHVGGVLVVHSPELVNRPLEPAYRHLGYEWSPAATGSLSAVAPVDVPDALTAMADAMAALGHDLEPVGIDPDTMALAHRIAPDHAAPIA